MVFAGAVAAWMYTRRGKLSEVFSSVNVQQAVFAEVVEEVLAEVFDGAEFMFVEEECALCKAAIDECTAIRRNRPAPYGCRREEKHAVRAALEAAERQGGSSTRKMPRFDSLSVWRPKGLRCSRGRTGQLPFWRLPSGIFCLIAPQAKNSESAPVNAPRLGSGVANAMSTGVTPSASKN